MPSERDKVSHVFLWVLAILLLWLLLVILAPAFAKQIR
jgi:hypothetical protein